MTARSGAHRCQLNQRSPRGVHEAPWGHHRVQLEAEQPRTSHDKRKPIPTNWNVFLVWSMLHFRRARCRERRPCKPPSWRGPSTWLSPRSLCQLLKMIEPGETGTERFLSSRLLTTTDAGPSSPSTPHSSEGRILRKATEHHPVERSCCWIVLMPEWVLIMNRECTDKQT